MILRDERVLLVGGDERLHRRFERLLSDNTRRRYSLEITLDYHDACTRLSNSDVSVCLIADRIGEYESLDLLREYFPSNWQVPCVLVQSQPNPDFEELALRMGAAGFLVESFELTASSVESVLSSALGLQDDRSRILAGAFRDRLTRLVSRRLFEDRFELAVSSAKRHETTVGLILLDFDGFRAINRKYGPGAADGVLQQYAFRVQIHVRSTDTLARYRGDQLVMFLPSIQSTNNLAMVAARMLKALQTPFHCESHRINVSATCGLGLFPDHGEDSDSLMAATAKALKKAKRDARGRFALAKAIAPATSNAREP